MSEADEDVLAQLRELLKDEPPIKIRFGKTKIFSNSDYDVVMVEVKSADLKRINKKIADAIPHTSTHQVYVPHATIAYVKSGLGKKYIGRDDLEGVEETHHSIYFSNRNREETEIPLKSAKAMRERSRKTSGGALHWTDNDLVALSEATNDDKEQAVKMWKRYAPKEAQGLLNAKVKD